MPYTEVLKASRGFSQSATDIKQDFEYIITDEAVDGDDGTYGTFFTPNDDVSIVDYIAATFPSFRVFRSIEGIDVVLFLQDFTCDEITNDVWRIKLSYTIPQDESQGSAGYVQFGFSVGGAQVHMEKSKSVVASVSRTGSGLTPPESYGFMNITKSGAAGVDVPGKGLLFNITGYFSPGLWDTSFLNLLYQMSTCYNNNIFYGFAAGEVLFLSADGQGSAYRLIPIKFDFMAKPNISAQPDPPFPDLTMLGHDYASYLGAPETSNDFQIRAPFYRYIHRLFDPANFDLLGV